MFFLHFLFLFSCTDNSFKKINIPHDTKTGRPELYCDSAILADYDTGKVLYEKNSDEIIPPASMTKLVVNYIVFKEIERGIFS